MPDRPLRAVELFAGVGGFAAGLEGDWERLDPRKGWLWDATAGPGQVVWANQWEPSTKRQHAAECYRAQFPDTPMVDADIHAVLDRWLDDDEDALVRHALTRVSSRGTAASRRQLAEELAASWEKHRFPEDDEFNLLVGGFPCQDYSVAKPRSQATGIAGKKGVLWWEIFRILEARQPRYVLLENVDRLLKSPATHRGRDFAIMLSGFAELGYEVEWRVINAAAYGFPQRRRRVFIFARLADTVPGAEFGEWASGVLKGSGLIQEAFPCELGPVTVHDVLLDTGELRDEHDLSVAWTRAGVSPWDVAGVMSGGRVATAPVTSPTDEDPLPLRGASVVLRDVLLPLDDVLNDPSLRSLLIPATQLDFAPDGRSPRPGSWNYLKGAKREPREKDGFEYTYSEGPIRFPEPLGVASRTILTGEGGTSPSRFKLVVAQPMTSQLLDQSWPDEVQDAVVRPQGKPQIYRRLAPRELARLNMFADNWLDPIASESRQAFCMGNALVVGIVQRFGEVLAARAADGY